ncbi:MAG: alanine--tRNA ligase-related protein, partial [Flavobacteriales bacterium]
ENDLKVDMEGFNKELQKQKQRSREATEIKAGDWQIINDLPMYGFIGYDNLSSTAKIIKYRRVQKKKTEIFQLIFDQTPFYPEGGGQIGDKGYIENDEERIEILNTYKENELIIHESKKRPKYIERAFKAVVDENKRKNAANNHTATHLLHDTLREV